MSYLVLARKLRPQRFDEVVAQGHITDTLKNAIKSDRISHAYLFCGTRGTGKTTTARILAKALNCEHGPAPEPCNECTNCREISSSSSMDVIEIDAASNTGVDSIRDLRENAHYSPANSKYKIYIIDEVHRLSGAAFDALLKTLEEPPSHVIFIFATTEPHNLPATILSRTQRYDFRRIPMPDLMESLKRAADGEGIKISDEALAMIARKGDGSLRDAQSVFEQIMAYADSEITVDLITDALGLVDLNVMFELTEAIHAGETRMLIDRVAHLVESGADIAQVLVDFQEHLRNLLIVRSVEDPSQFVEVSDQYITRYQEQREFFSESDIMRMVKVISDLRQQLKEGADPRIYLEMTLIRLARMDKTATLAEILKKLNTLSQSNNTITQESSSPTLPLGEPVSQVSEKKTLTSENSGNDIELDADSGLDSATWNRFLKEFGEDNSLISNILSEGSPEIISGDKLRLVFPRTSGARTILTDEKLKVIETALRNRLGRTIKVDLRFDESTKGREISMTLDPRFDMTPEDLFKKNPDIKKIVDRYDGKITSIKRIESEGDTDG